MYSVNKQNQVIRTVDSSIAVIRMRLKELTISPDSKHFYTSQLYYRDQDCPNSNTYSYYDEYIPAKLEKFNTLDEFENLNDNYFIDNKLTVRDTQYFEEIRNIYEKSITINPATCSWLVFAILEKRALNQTELEAIAIELNVPVSDFYQNLDKERAKFKLAIKQIDEEYASLSQQPNVNDVNDVNDANDADAMAVITYTLAYNKIREQFNILSPFYYKNKIHPFLNLYRNIKYNSLIEQGLFQICWVAGLENKNNQYENNQWVYIGNKKLPIDDNIVNTYEYIEIHNTKQYNSMFKLYPSDEVQEIKKNKTLSLYYKQKYYESLDFMYSFNQINNQKNDKIKIIFVENFNPLEFEIEKALLIFHSNYFKTLFEDTFCPVEECICDVDHPVIGESIINYFKTGIIEPSILQMVEFQTFADKYLLKF